MREIRFWRGLLTVLIILGALAFLGIIWRILLPFIFGCVIAYLVNPLVDRFVSMGYKRNRIVLILYLLLLGTGITLCVTLIPPLIQDANAAMKEVPTYAATFDKLIANINLDLQRLLKPVLRSKAQVLVVPFSAAKFIESLVIQMPENILNFAHAGLWIIIIPFVSFFALSHGPRWINSIFDMTPSEYVESLLGIMAELNATLGGYIRGMILESFCVGFITIIGLWCMGVNGAVLLGVITGFVNFVPFMAPLVGGGLALLTAWVQFKSASVLFGVFLLYAGVRILDDFVLIPFIVGSSVHLHPVVMVFAVLAGVELGGFIGLVFAIPAAVIIKVLLSVAVQHRKEQLMYRQHIYS